jgi:ABC-type polysaccharide/polyol phosphate export permease
MQRLLKDWREMLHEQFEYRELLLRMTKRDLLLRYKQTAMGFGWAIFAPLVNTAVFSVIFTRVAPIQTPVPYPLFAYCGFLTWNLTASALKFAVTSLSSNTNLVTKVYFPRELFPVSAVLLSLVDFLVASIVLVGMLAYYRMPVGWPLLALPVIIAIQIMFTTAIALLLSMGNLFYRDVKYLFEIIIVLWMFATSVVYPATLVGGRLGAVLQLNPMTPIIEAYRAVLLMNSWPSPGPLSAVGGCSACFFGFAWLVFHRAEFQFAENV